MRLWTARRAALLSPVLLLASLSLPARGQDVVLDTDALGGLQPRCIGPATMGGRIAALDGVPGDKPALWVGAAGGGVWKSSDGGVTFKPVFDKYTQSIGAVAIDQAHPQTVWVGTGVSWTRNSVSAGDGLYKTTDGGESWTRVGLENSERIARIAIDPTNSEIVYVAVTGHLWNSSPERGVYKTTDGGTTWTRILYVDATTGCSDISLDAHDPKVLFAGMWQFRRSPWSFSSGGPGSGLYRSADGGATWARLSKGLPSGDLGRIAVAVAPSASQTVYAAVEAKDSGLFRSDDGGASWTRVNSGSAASLRPFYFQHMVVDPTDAQRVFKMSLSAGMSEDGGKTFTPVTGGVHGDHHALWINPLNPRQMVLGTDGGVYMSENRGNDWRMLPCLPVAQFYHVTYDMDRPYNVYGGLQDNGTWTGPSTGSSGVAPWHWRNLNGGDGFWSVVDPQDPDLVYVEYQGGHLSRVRRSTGESKEIAPYPAAGEPELRFNWNAPLHASAARGGTLYMGAQSLYRSTDRGESWQRVSPDLTTHNPAKLQQINSGGLSRDNTSAENHCTIYAIGESPRDSNVVWVGTDDGNVQVTRNGGTTWTDVTRRLRNVPPYTSVSFVAPSPFAASTCYITLDGHATGDMTSYAFVTTDFGATWRSLATPAVHGYAHCIRQDLVNPDLVFWGTEHGLFVSFDNGAAWARIGGNFPPVAVRDLALHPREGDLLIATHGRGIWILDDLTPLRALTPATLQQDVAFLASRPSSMTIPTGEQRFDGGQYWIGDGVPEVATITYYLKKRHLMGDLKLEIADAQGTVLSTFPGGKRRGVNRVQWPMRRKPPRVPAGDGAVQNPYAFVGPRVPAGTYTVTLRKGDQTYGSQVMLVGDPRAAYSADERAAQQVLVSQLYDLLGRFAYVVGAVGDMHDQLQARAAALPAADAAARRATHLAEDVEALRVTLVASKGGGILNSEMQLRERLATLYGAVNGYDGRPTGSQVAYAEVLGAQIAAAGTTFEALLAQDLAAVNALLAARQQPAVVRLTEKAWHARQDGK